MRKTILMTLFGLTCMAQSTVSRGKIVDTANNGIAGVKMTFTSMDESHKFAKEVTTGDDGSFTIAGLKTVQIEVLAEKEGYRPQIYRYKQNLGEVKFEIQMLTIEEAIEEAKASGEIPEATPEDLAIDNYNLALPLYQSGKYKEALEFINISLEQNPELDASMKMGAYITHKLESWDQAISFGEAYLKINPDDTNMMKLVADAASQGNKGDVLSKYTEKIEAVEGVSVDGLYNKAVEHLNANNDEGAKPLLEKIIEMDENYAEAYHRLGEVMIREAEFDKGIELLKKYLRLAPNSPHKREVEDLIITLVE